MGDKTTPCLTQLKTLKSIVPFILVHWYMYIFSTQVYFSMNIRFHRKSIFWIGNSVETTSSSGIPWCISSCHWETAFLEHKLHSLTYNLWFHHFYHALSALHFNSYHPQLYNNYYSTFLITTALDIFLSLLHLVFSKCYMFHKKTFPWTFLRTDFICYTPQ